jgi:hypothetical protein
MDVNVNTTVTHIVSSVAINNIIINKSWGNQISLVVPYQWLDTNGNVIKTGSTYYTEQNLIRLLGAQSSSFLTLANIFGNLMPAGIYPNIILNIGNVISATSGSWENVDGQLTWVANQITSDQINQLLSANNVQSESISGLIQFLTAQIFQASIG